MGPSSQSEDYVLRGGRAGADRLRLLNRVKWPTTEPLLRMAGLRAGMSCLDIGCGSGDVTLKMAALVGAEGHVVGVDRRGVGRDNRRPVERLARTGESRR